MSFPPALRVPGYAAGAGFVVVGFMARPGSALGGVAVAAFVGAALALRLYEQSALGIPTRRRTVVSASGTVLSAWLVGTGVLVVLGPSIQSALIALLLVGVPAALHMRARFGRSTQPPAPSVQLPVTVPSPVLGTLSTPELCLAWRRSYLALVDLPAGPGRGDLVAVRQSMLDELERRDTAGFHRWLDAGARAGGDPARYLVNGPGV